MENGTYPRQTGAPPQYKDQGYQPLTEELVDFRGPSSCQVQSTVITVTPDEPPVRDHLVWSIFNLVYMNFCCLGLIALAFSVKSRDRKLYGDKNGARSYGTTSRSLNIAATILSIIFTIIVIAVWVTSIIALVNQVQQMQEAAKKENDNPFNPGNFGNYGK
ncbi:interferon-induced transmembrane protein 1-like [Discoglossus pictus]